MGDQYTRFTVYVVILSILLMELSYFLFCSIWYIYNNPQYRVLWAAFCREAPNNIKIVSPKTKQNKGIPKKQLQVKVKSNSVYSLIDTSFRFNGNHISSKKDAFIYYGLETISHCLFLLIFLIFTIIYMSIRMKMELIAHENKWSQFVAFCQFAVRLRSLFISLPNYFFLLFLCIPPLKVEFITPIPMITKRRGLIPVIFIIYIMVCCVFHTIIQLSNQYNVINFGEISFCSKVGGIGMNVNLVIYNSVQFGICILLSFVSFIIPLCVQKKMLKNLPNHENNEKVLKLIATINNISKRVFIFGGIGCLSLVIINALFYVQYDDIMILSYMFMAYFVIWVHLYFCMIFIYDDWKIRTCPLYYYCINNYEKQQKQKQKNNDIELEDGTTNTTSSGFHMLPRLDRSVTTLDELDQSTI